VANRDCTTVWIYASIIICNSKVIKECQYLNRKRFVDFKGTDIANT
jgi:hypothetical protein